MITTKSGMGRPCPNDATRRIRDAAFDSWTAGRFFWACGSCLPPGCEVVS